MANRKSRFRQVCACILTAGMLVGGLSVTTLQVSAEEMDTGDLGSDRLTGVSLDVYQYLKEEIQKVADGNRENTEYDISSLVHTLEEAWEIKDNLEIINRFLLMDCPYDLYWYDKSAKDERPGVQGAASLNYNYTSDGQAIDVIVRMLVSKEYRPVDQTGSGDSWYYTVDAGRSQNARTIPAKAQEIVDANAGKSDYEKLLAYKNTICDLAGYDEAALGENFQLSNEPWQLISVFDGDPNTNVVCEGYSRAFQYLCNLSEFDHARCYTVSGGMAGGTGAGSHMWNIVTIDGANYLVDVTNCDEGTIGAPDLLFLAAPSEGSWDTQYNFPAGINYKYDSIMEELFGADILTLAGTDYEAPAAPGDSELSGQPDTSLNQESLEQPDDTGNSDPSNQEDQSGETDPSQKKKQKNAYRSQEQDTAKAIYDVVSLDPSDQSEYQAVEAGIRAAYVQNGDELEFVDASKIGDVVRYKLARKHRISAADVQVHEITLKVKNENGDWETVSTENFPKKGIRITMPYPEGTSRNGFRFYGQHLFAKDMNGYAAGTTEDLKIMKRNRGISFVVHGLSPISIGWSEDEHWL